MSVADLARRFPQQMGQLQRGLQRMCEDPTGKTVTPSVHATTTGASASATAHGKITETAHGLPPEPPPSPFAEQMSTAGTIRPPARPPVATGLEPPPAAAPPRAGAARPADESVAGELHTIRPGESEPEIDLSEVTRKVPTSTSRYHILRELGRGAMGTVYLAQDTQARTASVAMKVPHFRPGDGPEMLARFYREARSAGHARAPEHLPGVRRRRERRHPVPDDGVHRGRRRSTERAGAASGRCRTRTERPSDRSASSPGRWRRRTATASSTAT